MVNIRRFWAFGAAASASFAFIACGGGGGGGDETPAEPAYPESLSGKIMNFNPQNRFIFAPADENGSGMLTGVRDSVDCVGSYEYVSGHLKMSYSRTLAVEGGERFALEYDGTISVYSASTGQGTFSGASERTSGGAESPFEALPLNFTLSARTHE